MYIYIVFEGSYEAHFRKNSNRNHPVPHKSRVVFVLLNSEVPLMN